MPRAKGGSIPPPPVMVEPGCGGSIIELNENDVLCGRGGKINNHPGNVTFRAVVEHYKHEYLDPRTRKLEKAHVAARLVAQIRNATPPGRFLRDDPSNPGRFLEIGDLKAWKSEWLEHTYIYAHVYIYICPYNSCSLLRDRVFSTFRKNPVDFTSLSNEKQRLGRRFARTPPTYGRKSREF